MIPNLPNHLREHNAQSLEAIETILAHRADLASSVGQIPNIISLFFHELVIHFTGILLIRELSEEFWEGSRFPWINSKYARDPFGMTPSPIDSRESSPGLVATVKQAAVVNLAIGDSIPFGYKQQKVVHLLLKILGSNQPFVRACLPRREYQYRQLTDLIHTLCRRFEVPNPDIVAKNWIDYSNLHTTENEERQLARLLIVGTRNNLENRKKAINFLAQDKKVIGMTHGEISNSVYDEPVYGYSDLGFCSTLVDYGDFAQDGKFTKPFVKPVQRVARSSTVIKRSLCRRREKRTRRISGKRTLYIPTMYQSNYLYGPFHSCPNDDYLRWQRALVKVLPEVIFKQHPKSRIPSQLECRVEERRLEDCLGGYDALIFDYLATGAVLASFSQVPVLYFNIGLRRLSDEFSRDIAERCFVVPIDWHQDLEMQVESGVDRFLESAGQSVAQLERYVLTESEEFGKNWLFQEIFREK